MARSYSLSTILAIAIPLGTVALIGILALSFLIIRMSVISANERRAYIMAQNSDFRRRSAASSESLPRSYKRRRRRQDRGCCDVLCCVPTTDDLLGLPASQTSPSAGRAARPPSHKRPNNGNDASGSAAAKPSDLASADGPSRGSAPDANSPTEKASGGGAAEAPSAARRASFDDLTQRTSAALEAAERLASQATIASDVARAPPSVSPPKPPSDISGLPSASAPPPPSPPPPAASRSSREHAQRDKDAALAPRTPRTSSESPLFVPSVWSYPVSLSLNDGHSLSASRMSQSSRKTDATRDAALLGRPRSGESRLRVQQVSANRPVLFPSPAQPPVGTKQSMSGLFDTQNSSQQLLAPLQLDETPPDLDLSAFYNPTDLVPPAKSALRSLKSRTDSPASSLRATATHASPVAQGTPGSSHSITTPRSAQLAQRTGSSHSIYQTPPVAPLGSPARPSSLVSSGYRRLRSEYTATPSIRDEAVAGASTTETKRASWTKDGAVTAVSSSPKYAPSSLARTSDAASAGAGAAVGVAGAADAAVAAAGAGEAAAGAGEAAGASEAAEATGAAGATEADMEAAAAGGASTKSAGDAERQRILGLLKRDDSLHGGHGRTYGQHVEPGRAAIPSYTGSLVRDSGVPLLDAGLSLSADRIQHVRAELDPTRNADFNGAHSYTDLSRPVTAQSELEFRSDSGISFTPTSLDKLFGASESEMMLPLLDSSDESRRSKQSKRGRKDRGSRQSMGTPLTGSNSSTWLSSRSSSLTASSTYATPSGAASTTGESRAAPRDTAAPRPAVPPLVVKTSSSIRNIALLSVPRTPRSPGYSPGQLGAQPLTPDAGAAARRTSSYSGKAVRRLSVLGYRGDAGAFVKGSKPQSPARLGHEASGRPRGGAKKKTSSPRVRVSKNTRMNKPLPTMPNAAEDGLLTNLSGARYFVIQAYEKNLNDEISLDAGEIVRVFQVFDDGWSLVRLDADPSRKGICPHSCLKPLET